MLRYNGRCFLTDLEGSFVTDREIENSHMPSADGGKAPVELVVFDFDGTSINGNSPVILVRRLVRQRRLKVSVIARIVLWGAAYKLRLPQSESWVRGLVFRAYAGMPKREVDERLRKFYDEAIAGRFRDQADATMRSHRAQGRVVLVVSATFEPIVERAQEHHPFDFQISTRMEVDEEGNYTCRVAGEPVEGEEKPRAIERFANERFGEGNWTIAYAYGDHHSDRPMLGMAKTAVAVNPDRPLKRTARREGWQIVDWE